MLSFEKWLWWKDKNIDRGESFPGFKWSDENHLFHTNAVTITGTLYKPGKNTLLHFSNNEEACQNSVALSKFGKF